MYVFMYLFPPSKTPLTQDPQYNEKSKISRASELPISRSNLGTPSSGKASSSSALSDNCAFKNPITPP